MISKPKLMTFKALALASAASIAISGAAGAQAVATVEFDIEAQDLSRALTEFGVQSRTEVLFNGSEVRGISTDGLSGSYSADQAIELLLDDTGIDYRQNADGTILVGKEYVRKASLSGQASNQIVLAQATPEPTASDTPTEIEPESDPFDEEARQDVVVVTGTNIRGADPVGAQILTLDRGDIDLTGLSTTAEVLRQLPQNLAAGANEATTSIVGSGDGAVNNIAFGSGVNLRGLGTNRTLTLLNSRRLAPGGFSGDFVDVSLVPLAAVERIEVLPDGASALYGSDAIGGVVNIRLRDDYEGAETRVRYGSVTDGDLDELQFSQVFGTSWDSGNALIAYEYFEQGQLDSSDRAFAANSDLTSLGGSNFNLGLFGNPGTLSAAGQFFAIPAGQDGTNLTAGDLSPGVSSSNTRLGTTLLPSQERHSVFGSVNQRLDPKTTVFVEGYYTNREFESLNRSSVQSLIVPSSNPFFVDPVGGQPFVQVFYNFFDDLGPIVADGQAESYGLSAGTSYQLTEEWTLDLSGAFSTQKDDQLTGNQPNLALLGQALADPDPSTAFNPFGDGANTNVQTVQAITGFSDNFFEHQVWSINGKADGPLFEMPGGDALVAVGFEYRDESYESGGTEFITTAEVIPQTAVESDLGRDVTAVFAEVILPFFGETNKRPGFEKLEASLAVRHEDYSDFGTTTNPKVGVTWEPNDSLLLRGSWGTSFRAPILSESDPNGQFVVATLFADPASPGTFLNTILQVGDNPDLEPEEATTWTIGLDFNPSSLPEFSFGLTYFDTELENRTAAILPFTALQRENEFSAFIQRDPTTAAAQALLDSPFLLAPSFFTADQTNLIIDGRLSNTAFTNINGLDAQIGYSLATDAAGTFSANLSGTYFFEYEEALTADTDFVDVLDTVGRQVDLRLRGNLSWTLDGVTAAVFLNHTDGYEDDISDQSIDAWTTADVTLSYNTSDRFDADILNGVTVRLSANNLFDEEPPFVNNANGVAFDPVNANPRGRFVALELVKEW